MCLANNNRYQLQQLLGSTSHNLLRCLFQSLDLHFLKMHCKAVKLLHLKIEDTDYKRKPPGETALTHPSPSGM